MHKYRFQLLPQSVVFLLSCAVIFTSCTVQKKISKTAKSVVLNQPALQAAHVGISIFDPATNKYLYNFQGDKYFVPASNTKIPTCYVAMKYLDDSLAGIQVTENDTAVLITATGDPTLLHPGFKNQPVISFLSGQKKKIYFRDNNWQDQPLGSGWSWNDYNEDYMAEKSPLPVYGNIIKWFQEKNEEGEPAVIYSEPEIPWEVTFNIEAGNKNFDIQRSLASNIFKITEGNEKSKTQSVPFVTNGIESALQLLKEPTAKELRLLPTAQAEKFLRTHSNNRVIFSQPTDSMLSPMMHRSDNFFAEQSLLMVSNALLGIMSDNRIIDTILKTDFKDLPQRPRWADGSGLSRYNLFTPQDFIAILHKMEKEFGMQRIKAIFPTGGEGTISNYYKEENGYIFAKTGTLSGVVAFSGFLYTRKDKLLIFSILINNHQASSTDIRRAVEKFILEIRAKY
jgi:D-alanyl-D-alanine carboxypeptidase/D-alanyl-D-alanine-endopeptidase (penicillin-binding protein 4)